jgi:DUF917 family protein
MRVDWETAEALVHGGAILGGGGGGSMASGLETAHLALSLGSPEIVSISDLSPESLVVTVSAVGAPAAKEKYVKPMDFVHCVQMVMNVLDRPLGGLIQNEMGGFASANGLIQSAVLGVPLIDAPCNGRAHPFALMGSLGLHKKEGYHSIQAACGGDPFTGRKLEILTQGRIESCSSLVREASIQAGGLVAVARNPIPASWLAETASVGALKYAIELGRANLNARKSKAPPWDAVKRHLSGEIVGQGTVAKVQLVTKGGFDIGTLVLDSELALSFLNEFITLDFEGTRRYTFPDLITLFEKATGEVVNSAEVEEGMEVVVLAARQESLILGAGMFDMDLSKPLESLLNRPVARYAGGGERCCAR